MSSGSRRSTCSAPWTVILYKLFKAVDQSLAMLMVILVCIGVTVALANLVSKFGPWSS